MVSGIHSLLILLTVLWLVNCSNKTLRRVKKKLDNLESKVDRQATNVRKEMEKLSEKVRRYESFQCDTSDTQPNTSLSSDNIHLLTEHLADIVDMFETRHDVHDDIINNYPALLDAAIAMEGLKCHDESDENTKQVAESHGEQLSKFADIGRIGIINNRMKNTLAFIKDRASLFGEKIREIETEERLLGHMKDRLMVLIDNILNQTNVLTEEHVNEVQSVLQWQKKLMESDPFFEAGDRVYFIEDERNVTWVEAMKACNTIGGYLAELNDRTEEVELTSALLDKMTDGQVKKLWLGSKRELLQRWLWHHSGDIFWAEIKLHRIMDEGLLPECVLLHQYDDYGQLEVEWCNYTRNFICEFDN